MTDQRPTEPIQPAGTAHFSAVDAGETGGGNEETSAPEPVAAGGRRPGSEPMPAPREGVPGQVGAYRVLGELGRGGMGSVYMAVRDDDRFRKRVALKVMRRGVDTDEMLERFRLERQVLGALNHPYIARVFDAGATEDGRPYFVMEYVEGMPITEYCDEHNLSVAERLALFRKVCEAVHEAHRNLVVHRDLKPSNILVGPAGEPKLLDFGIAKLLNPELIGLNALTRPEQRLMTYEYASPEQVQGQAITTASDVYALGVLLYELLVGRRPYDIVKRVHQEAVRVICEEEPERPSTAISKAQTIHTADGKTRTVTGEEVARRRELGLTKLRRELSGDIDNIVLMALRKSPNRRYATAMDLAEDLDRHLRGQPVKAGPDTLRYRSAKFAMRHRRALAAAGVVALALVLGMVGTAWQAERATRAREVAERERGAAERRYEALRRVTRLYDAASDKIRDIEGATVARRVLVETMSSTLAGLEAELSEDPGLRLDLAEQLRRVGELEASLGAEVSGGAATLERSLALLDGLDPELEGVPMARAAALVALAEALRDSGRLAEAEASAAAATKVLSGITGEPRATLLVIEAARITARCLQRRGAFAEATAALEAALPTAAALAAEEGTPGAGHVALAALHDERGAIADAQGEWETALDAYLASGRAAMRVVDADARNRPARGLLLRSLERRANALGVLGRHEDAAKAYTDAQDLARRTLEWDPVSAKAQLDYARVFENEHEMLTKAGEHAAALAAAERFLTEAQRLAAADPSDMRRRRQVAVAFERIGNTLNRLDRPIQARAPLASAVDAYDQLAQRDPATTEFLLDLLRSTLQLGIACNAEDDTAGMRRAWDRGIDAGRRLEQRGGLDEEGRKIYGSMLRNRGRVAIGDGDGPLAVELLVAAQAYRRRDDAKAFLERAQAYRLAGRTPEAIAELEKGVEVVGKDGAGAADLAAMLAEVRGTATAGE